MGLRVQPSEGTFPKGVLTNEKAVAQAPINVLDINIRYNQDNNGMVTDAHGPWGIDAVEV